MDHVSWQLFSKFRNLVSKWSAVELINIVLEIGFILDNTAEMIRIVNAFTTELSQQIERKRYGWVYRIRNKMTLQTEN